ncbi:hypothetical protein ACIGFK_29815 [Streptomyces sp. NPDC085524]|uniref:hypothetical protein n=1 Tax=unclassified Streptomyces TaxID=2593676 RepID=UPI0035E32F08
MKYFGFYDAMLYKIGSGIRAVDLPRGPMRSDRAALAAYMGACEGLVAVPGVECDPFDETRDVMGGFSLRTDGEWVWPDMARHLVRVHELVVPEEFEQRVVERDFVAPALTHEQILGLFRSVEADLY